jgi:hypothetical protein
MEFIQTCSEPNTNVPAGKCLWRFDRSEITVNNGWVFVACNCAGKCCAPPTGEAEDGTYLETDAVACPPPAKRNSPPTLD